MSTIISVVSGKGGSGKSLLTAVLGQAIAHNGQSVLLIDLDIFVRGLTVLLQNFKKRRTTDPSITTSDIFGIYSSNSQSKEPSLISEDKLSFQRFFACDVLPAVSNLADPLDYNDKELSSFDFCRSQIGRLLKTIGDKYDFIFLDNRAGMDSLVLASCVSSHFILAISEDDQVGQLTNNNLINFLKYNHRLTKVYSIINKARRIRDYDDLTKRSKIHADYITVGVVPFDMEILEDFGSEHFWISVNETLYFKALLDSWNNLAGVERIREIPESNYKFPPRIFMNKKQGRYTFMERMLRVYSILFILSGAGIYLYTKISYERLSNLDLISIISFMLGFATLILSTSNFRSFILGVRSSNSTSEKQSS